LAGVEVLLGVSDVAAAGAGAVTDGQAMAFADENPTFRDVAHEVAHGGQAGWFQGSGQQGMDAGGGGAEIEAEDAAARAERGEQVQLSASLDAGLHRTVENPTPFDPSTDVQWDARHDDITVQDGYQTGDDAVAPTNENSSEVASVAWSVDVLHDEANPLLLNGCPREDLLYTVTDNSAQDCSGSGEAVLTRFGSTVAPNIRARPADAIFIDGSPTIDDIKQAGVGDCYFLAALSNIAATDPERITQTIQPAGANVNVRFFKTTDGGTTWVAETITTDRTALHWFDTTDPSQTYEGLIAAQCRLADRPKTSEWYVNVDNGSLSVFRRDIYEMAMWAPLLEKAYARFAECTNQYGGGSSRDTPNTGASGYDQINGGWEDQVYPIFYGSECVQNRQREINFTPGADLVMANLPSIGRLLRVSGQDNQPGHLMLSVDLDQGSAVERLDQLIDHILGLRDSRRYPGLCRTLSQLNTLAETYINAAEADQPAALKRLARAAARNVRPGAWPLLERPNTDKIWNDLYEHLNIIAHLSRDASEGQRNAYADHAYAVLGASFSDNAGAGLALTLSNLAAEANRIDSQNSTVQLRNPHHGNEPNLPTSNVDSNTDDGLFTMTLDQYLRSFALEQIARVQDTP
jgi:hypothetical protein